MQKTSHLQLNTWAENDPVSLAQINENFTLLDADLSAKTAAGQNRNAAIQTLAQHEAHRALEAYHANAASGTKENLLLADFAKPDDWSAVSGVRLQEACIQNAAGTYTGYQKYFSSYQGLSDEQWCAVDSFEALEDGNLDAIAVKVCIDGAETTVPSADLRVKDGDTVIATFSGCCENSQPVFASCPLCVGRTYVIEMLSTKHGYSVSVVGNFAVSVTPAASQSGCVITKEIGCAGSALYAWVHYTGDAPTVSMLSHSGAETALTVLGTKTGTDLAGGSTSVLALKKEPFGLEEIRIKAQITGQTSITAVCGIIL